MKLIRYDGTFVDCKTAIERAGQEIATARQGMQDRIRQGPNSSYRTKGCWHSEGTARIDGTNYWCLEEFAPTTHHPQETLEANARGKYLSLTDEIKLGEKPASQLIKEIAEQDAELPVHKRRVLIPEKQDSFSVLSEDLADVDITKFLARDQRTAKAYGEFLEDRCKIPVVWFYQIGNDFDNVGAGFWLRGLGLGNGSCFDGNIGGFYDDIGSLFGVAKREALSREKVSAKPNENFFIFSRI